MRYEHQIGPDAWELVTGDVTIGDTFIPFANLAVWSDDILDDFNIRRVDEELAPFTPRIPSISDRQFFQQCAIDGTITEDEALAAVMTGSIPAVLQTIVDGLPESMRFGAKMILSGATTFERDHPLANVIGQAFQKTDEEVDQFYINASQL